MTEAPPGDSTLVIDWNRLHRDTRLLSRRLRSAGPFKGIIAVPRGGLIPAALVACDLGLRLVDTVCVASYDERIQRADDPEILKAVAGDGEGWLVIDDLVDTGNTFRRLRQMLPAAYFATVYAKPQGAALADLTVCPVEQAVWLIFPWDTEPS